jgi:hypothetical protein
VDHNGGRNNAFDLWVDVWRKKRAQGDVVVVRYADDMILGFLGVLFGKSNRKPAPEPKFTDLSRADSARLEQQRASRSSRAKQRHGTLAFSRAKRDLPVLQNLIDEKVFSRSQTYELGVSVSPSGMC